jgi:fibronectin type 3 domain-containing protein
MSSPDNGTRLAGAPDPVTGVSASAMNCANIVVTWNGLSNVTMYGVYRDNGLLGSTGYDVTTFTDTTCAPGNYTYTVNAGNQCGQGGMSNPDVGTRQTIPPQVTGVSATDTICTNVVITWSASGGTTWGYFIFRDGVRIDSVANYPLRYTDTPNPGTYSYAVTGFNGCGGGLLSAADNGTRTTIGPAQVTGMTASDNSCNDVIITWNDVVGEDGYRIHRNGSEIHTTTANVTAYADHPASGTYTYSVQAYNSCGSGQLSSTDSGTRTLGSPDSVTGVSASDNWCYYIEIVWTDLANESGYYVYRNGTLIATRGPNNTSYVDAFGTGTHVYNVQAYNSCGHGAISLPDSGTQHSAPNQEVTDVAATDINCSRIIVTWNDLPDEQWYSVVRDSSVNVGTTAMNVTSIIDTTASPGAHSYVVYSQNSCGYGFPSTPVIGTRISGPPPQVTGVIASNLGCSSVTISWNNVTNEHWYYIYRNGIQVGATSTDTTTFTDMPGTGSYGYTVCAYNSCGVGTLSTSVNGVQIAVPVQVTGVTASENSCAHIVIMWQDVAYETAYWIYRDSALVATLDTNAHVYYDGFSFGTHSYIVQALNGCGVGAMSAVVTGTRLGSPAQVTGVAATNDNCLHITVTWSDVANETNYYVWRDGNIVHYTDADVTVYVDSLATTGTHSYEVRAYADECFSFGDPSTPVMGTRLSNPPAQVTGVSASDNDCNNVIISWNDISIENGYKVYRDGTQIGTTEANVTFLSDSVSGVSRRLRSPDWQPQLITATVQ